jgi:hypothetical protein
MEEDFAIQSDSKPKKWRRSVIISLAIIGIAAVVAILWWLFQRPSQGTITIAPAAEKINPADPANRRQYSGKYFTFSYPADFQRREENESVSFPLLERVFLSRSDVEGRKIALLLQDNADYRFEEYSSFRIRQNDPATYREARIERNGLSAVIFTKETSVFEVSAFIVRGKRVLSVAVTSPISVKGLEEELFLALDSFRWTEE